MVSANESSMCLKYASPPMNSPTTTPHEIRKNVSEKPSRPKSAHRNPSTTPYNGFKLYSQRNLSGTRVAE